jgi:hypothetical protein
VSSIVVGRPFGTDVTPPVDPFSGGGGSGWTKLVQAPNDIEAHLVIGRLAEAGIETQSLKDRSGPAWMFNGSNPWAPVTVLVRKLQLEDAQLVLAEVAFDAPAAVKEEPRHKSAWVAVVWWSAAIALGILFTALGWVQANETMESCKQPSGCEAPTRP